MDYTTNPLQIFQAGKYVFVDRWSEEFQTTVVWKRVEIPYWHPGLLLTYQEMLDLVKPVAQGNDG